MYVGCLSQRVCSVLDSKLALFFSLSVFVILVSKFKYYFFQQLNTTLFATPLQDRHTEHRYDSLVCLPSSQCGNVLEYAMICLS